MDTTTLATTTLATITLLRTIRRSSPSWTLYLQDCFKGIGNRMTHTCELLHACTIPRKQRGVLALENEHFMYDYEQTTIMSNISHHTSRITSKIRICCHIHFSQDNDSEPIATTRTPFVIMKRLQHSNTEHRSQRTVCPTENV